MIPPCDNCICVPMCRNKSGMDTIDDCSILKNFLHSWGKTESAVIGIPELKKRYIVGTNDDGTHIGHIESLNTGDPDEWIEAYGGGKTLERK